MYPKILLKNIWNVSQDSSVVKLALAVWFFIGGIHLYMYSVFTLSIIDVITGVASALKNVEPITSRKLRQGLLEKLVLYFILMISVFTLDTITQHTLHFTGQYFTFVITFLISTYEVTSIIENISEVRPNIPFLGSLKRIFKKMGESTVDNLEKKVDSITDFNPMQNGPNQSAANPNPSSETPGGSNPNPNGD